MASDHFTIEQTLKIAIEHHRAGQLVPAETIYQQILVQQPDNADALHLLGLIAQQSGQNEKAIELIERAVAQKPDWPEARHNLAVTHNALGVSLQERRDYHGAIAAYRQAIRIRPDYPEAYSNLCVALDLIGKTEDAIAAGQRAIAFNPANPLAFNNLGIALKKSGALDQAIELQLKAISLNPKFAAAYFSMGNALIAKGELDQAIVAFKNAISQQPNFSAAMNNLGNALMDAGQLDLAMAAYRQAAALNPQNSSYSSALLFSLYSHPDFDGNQIAEKHRLWAHEHADVLQLNLHDNIFIPDRPLRIGYVSPDFRDHPVARFIQPLLENHDHRQFEIFCYSATAKPDQTTLRLKSFADTWRDITMLDHGQAAALVRSDRIDILVDLAGHTSGARLMIFAQKPAPVQVSYLGYPGTTGLAAMDYRLTDHLTDPVGMTESFHTETLYRLPNTLWCFTPPPHAPAVVTPPLMQNGYVTFGSFNRLAKMTPKMMQMWARILLTVPHSRLLLKAPAFLAKSARDRVQSVFASHGINADRLTLVGPQTDERAYLAMFNQVDIALDTFPYHGTTTTCDTLWMGVPVITLAGQTHVSRVGASLLTNIGLTDLIATTPDKYVALAVKLANDQDQLINLRQTMREKMLPSPLMNAVQFTCDVESAYRQMWTDFLKLPPGDVCHSADKSPPAIQAGDLQTAQPHQSLESDRK